MDGEAYDRVNAIEAMLDDVAAGKGGPLAGEIKPELMESVLEIATHPHSNTAEAGTDLRELRARVREGLHQHGVE